MLALNFCFFAFFVCFFFSATFLRFSENVKLFFCSDSDIGNNQFGSSEKYPHENDENDDDFGLGEEE